MDDSLDLLEEKFRRVEQASERRALCEPELLGKDVVDPLSGPRKKPVVSVSYFGKQEEHAVDGLHSPLPSPLSAAASRSTFYHTLTNPRSVESLVSDNSKDGHDADEQHEILVERITGRQTLPQSVSSLLPRRLAHARSQIEFGSIQRSMVVDVSVETTTEASQLDVQTSTVYATRPSRSRAATVGVLSHGSLVERAKDFARKLRRKSRTELP